ncbi:MAG: DUF4838 domain-containing protein [Lentisphaeria bacterium]
MSKMIPVFLLLCTSVFAGIDFIVDGKETISYIVLDQVPTPTAQYAARELAEYIEKITGVNLLFEVGVGKSFKNIIIGYGENARSAGLTLDGIKHDGFRLVTRGNNLYIYGRDRATNRPVLGGVKHIQLIHIYNSKYDIGAFGDSGTLYGVYYFLREYLGVDWFMPGETGEVCPKSKDLIIPDIDVTVNPDFEYRTVMAGLFNFNHEFARWYRRVGYGAPFPVEINHSFYIMNKYQQTHPEWFALKDGKRDFNITCEGRGNLCLSQPGLLEAFIKEARNYFDQNPDKEIFCIMPNDWFNQICECPDCQKQADYDKPDYGKFSNYVWNFVNNAAKEIRKSHPDKFIGCCAYNSYMMIPDRVELEPNIAVMMTTALYYRFDDFYRMRNDELAYQWSHKTKRFYTWQYYCWDNTNPHLKGLPIIFSKWLENDLRKLKGVSRGEFIDGGSLGSRYQFSSPALNSINYYLTGRLLWNCNLNVDELMNDYCTKFFGPAASEMRKFWSKAENLWTNMDVKKRGPADNLNSTLYTKTELDELRGYLLNASAAVPAESAYAKRIAGIQTLFFAYADKVSNINNKIPVGEVKRTSNPPRIDGDHETLWNTANVMTFVESSTGGKPTAETEARLLHDDDNLYIFVHCQETNMKNINANCRNNDSNASPAIWDDDSVEIFLSPDRRVPDKTIQIIINSEGYYWDACYNSREYPQDTPYKYNSGLTVKTSADKEGWRIEVAIPKKNLAVDGVEPTSEWRVNLCRNRWVSEIDSKSIERSSWSPTLVPVWRTPSRFGYLKFQ